MTDTRADRVRGIREVLGDTQKQFAERLTHIAGKLGFEHTYTENLISKMEAEYRDTSLADVAVLEAVDPANRGWFWFAFGRVRPHVARPRTKTGAEQLGLREPQRGIVPRGKQKGEG